MRSKRDWAIAGGTTLIVLLLVACVYLVFQPGAGLEMVKQAIGRLPGLQWMLTRLEVEWAVPRAQAARQIEAGAALESEERYREAIEAYEKALELVPDEMEAYLGLARAHEALEEWDQVRAQLETAQEIDPEDATVLRQLGRLQCMFGANEECVETLEKAVRLAPDDAQVHFWLALAYQQSSQDGFDQALDHYGEALRLEPDLGRAYIALGDIYQSRPGNEPLAIEAYNKALQVAVKVGDEELATRARAALAQVYYLQDHYDKCIDEWTQVLEADPDDADAHRRLGLCYAMRRGTGDLERAVTEMETALSLDFQMDAYYFYLGQYYATRDEPARAMLAWDQFLRFSDNPELNAEVRRWMEAYQEALGEEE